MELIFVYVLIFVLPIWCLRSMVIVINVFCLVAIFFQIRVVFSRSKLRKNRLENYCARFSDLC